MIKQCFMQLAPWLVLFVCLFCVVEYQAQGLLHGLCSVPQAFDVLQEVKTDCLPPSFPLYSSGLKAGFSSSLTLMLGVPLHPNLARKKCLLFRLYPPAMLSRPASYKVTFEVTDSWFCLCFDYSDEQASRGVFQICSSKVYYFYNSFYKLWVFSVRNV